jgi:hypothetical protein
MQKILPFPIDRLSLLLRQTHSTCRLCRCHPIHQVHLNYLMNMPLR